MSLKHVYGLRTNFKTIYLRKKLLIPKTLGIRNFSEVFQQSKTKKYGKINTRFTKITL